MRYLFFGLIVFLKSLQWVQAQVKYEKETRLRAQDVPKQAINFVQALGFDKKIKWYHEEGINRTSIEAKTTYKTKKYSVEFTPIGDIEDIEIEVEWKSLPPATQAKIWRYLVSEYEKIKIHKVQRQYTGSPETLSGIHSQKIKSRPTVRYEIIVKTKTNCNYEVMEYLFAENGEMEKASTIVHKNTDYLKY